MSDVTRSGLYCGVCREAIPIHEHTLFLGGFGNLVQVHTGHGDFLVHDRCCTKFKTRSELVRFLTDGREDLSYLE